jgi:homoserine O-acetyltransferase
LQWDANDLLAKLWTWQCADISEGPTYQSDFHRALAAIKARAILIPCSSDLYFPPVDNAIEVSHMPNAELRTYHSAWGHSVASPGNDSEFAQFLDNAIIELLETAAS